MRYLVFFAPTSVSAVDDGCKALKMMLLEKKESTPVASQIRLLLLEKVVIPSGRLPSVGVARGSAKHILPHSLIGHVEDTDTERENSLKSGKAIVVYMHGNSGSRAGSHRVELYNLLQSLDCHVVCFDYRGYADSTPVQPCERGVCADATSVFKWVYDRRGKSPVYIWGHSLGTGVASHVVGEICQRGSTLPIPDGLILESPFNNLQDEIRFHPMTWLYLEGQRHRPEGAPPITFFEFSEERGCGHKYICRVPELKSIISEFFDRCTTATWDEDSRTPHFQGGEVEM
ncbi:unnamed protein product [Cyprideis torosa]|uniref:AB hydrolase-1 domain-containing protein n=1 Tax=Cyprideis torosa TaxID=163714 RepID=A0A7R8ZLK2_9CRUS|nr:unnamed protein product [Cyprideis torosa]CAG0883899.1 unnamed protein product [Cyprideis torosa]